MGIIVRKKMNVYHHGGATGDIIYSLQAVKRLGGGVYYAQLPEPLFKAIKPLLEAQPYIHDVVSHSDVITHELDKFRQMQDIANTHLVINHLRAFGLSEDNYFDKWLDIEPHESIIDYAVINFTGRYHNEQFNWTEEYNYLKEKYGKVYFIGYENEFREFKQRFGTDIEYYPTETFLDVAQVIAGSKMFSGNQSAAMAIAQGMNHPHRIEVCPWAKNCSISSEFQTQLY